MPNTLEIKSFRDISVDDPFFSSLKQDYREFSLWFKSKNSETAYAHYIDRKLSGFMYLKIEEGEVPDVQPPLVSLRRTKIGSLKVDAHGTKLGERLIKKSIDYALGNKAEEIYITIFPKHKPLIRLLEEFGFIITKSEKKTENGTELVLIKSLNRSEITNDIRKDYPLINTRGVKYYLLGIKPVWHSQLFPDSILKSESYDLIRDVSHTNSISKTYICAMDGVEKIRAKDLLVIYRTSDGAGPAEYRSVASSICTVENVKNKHGFTNIADFLKQTQPYSVFNENELRRWWNRENMHVVQMLYNTAFTKRVIRKTLIEDVKLERDSYWGLMPLNKEQLMKIMNIGGVDASFIIH